MEDKWKVMHQWNEIKEKIPNHNSVLQTINQRQTNIGSINKGLNRDGLALYGSSAICLRISQHHKLIHNVLNLAKEVDKKMTMVFMSSSPLAALMWIKNLHKGINGDPQCRVGKGQISSCMLEKRREGMEYPLQRKLGYEA